MLKASCAYVSRLGIGIPPSSSMHQEPRTSYSTNANMSNTLHKLKDAVHPKPQGYSEPAGTYHPAAAPRTAQAAPGTIGGSAAASGPGYSSSGNYTTAATSHHHGHGHGTAAAATNLPGPAPTTAGPHRYDILNKLDPSVDARGAGQTVPGGATHHQQPVAHHPQPVAGMGGPASTTSGPHHSSLLNKLDPNVDSRTGAVKPTQAGPLPVQGGGHHHAAGRVPAQPEVPEGTYGPHKSRIANALDPRVDSDADRGRTGGLHSHAGAGAPTGGAPQGTYGPHHSRIANALDPRVDSDLDRNRPAAHGHGHGHGHATRQTAAHPVSGGAALPGPAPTTAGPHRSDLLNKLDPTVDSKPPVGPRY